MPPSQRILLIVGALSVFFVVARCVTKKRVMVQDAIFWVVLCGVLVFVAAVPGTIIWLAGMFGFQSPANLVFLIVITLLLIKEFNDSVELSILRYKMEELVHEEAFRRAGLVPAEDVRTGETLPPAEEDCSDVPSI